MQSEGGVPARPGVSCGFSGVRDYVGFRGLGVTRDCRAEYSDFLTSCRVAPQ